MNPRTVAYAVAAGSRSERAGTIAGGHRACPLSLVLTTELGRLHRAEAQPAGRSVPIDFVPLIDHHQHLFSSADAALVNDPPRTPRYQAPITSDDLIEMLDLAHIARAVVLSEAFWHDGPSPRSPDPYPLVRAENDWTAQQVAKYPKRLVAFCSFNPLADYALEELRRCASSKAFGGLKLGFASSGVKLSIRPMSRRCGAFSRRRTDTGCRSLSMRAAWARTGWSRRASCSTRL